MLYLTVTLGLIVVALIILLYLVLKTAREERASLLNRIMALSQPEALITSEAIEHPEPAEVSYVDESREYEIAHSRENGSIDLVGDE